MFCVLVSFTLLLTILLLSYLIKGLLVKNIFVHKIIFRLITQNLGEMCISFIVHYIQARKLNVNCTRYRLRRR